MAGYTIPFALPRQPRTPRYRPRRDFVVTAGDDVTLELTIYQDDMGGGPVDVTGAEATWTIWQEGSTALVEVTGDIEDAPAGRIDVVIAAAATTDIPGRYSHTLRIEFPNGMTTVVTGMIHIQPVYGTGTGGGDPGTMTPAEGIYGDVIIGKLTATGAFVSSSTATARLLNVVAQVSLPGNYTAAAAPFNMSMSIIRTTDPVSTASRDLMRTAIASDVHDTGQARTALTMKSELWLLGVAGAPVADSWGGSRVMRRFFITDNNQPVSALVAPTGAASNALPAWNCTWSGITTQNTRGGLAPEQGWAVGVNFLDYGSIIHKSPTATATGAINLTNSHLYEGGLFFFPKTSAQSAAGFGLNVALNAGVSPVYAFDAYSFGKRGRSSLGFRLGFGTSGFSNFHGLDPLRGTFAGIKGSQNDPIPTLLTGFDVRDVAFSGSALTWAGGKINGGTPGAVGTGSLDIGTGRFSNTATGASLNVSGYVGRPTGYVFTAGVDLIENDPVIAVRISMIGDDAYGGVYRFYGANAGTNTFSRAVVLTAPIYKGVSPPATVEIELRDTSGGVTEWEITETGTTTVHPTQLTTTIDDFYVDRILRYITGPAAGQEQVITAYDAATGNLTTAAFATNPTSNVSLVVNFNFGVALSPSPNTIATGAGWQWTVNGGTGTVTRLDVPGVEFRHVALVGDGTNAASIDQEVAFSTADNGVISVLAFGNYRIKIGPTRGSSDYLDETIIGPTYPEGETAPTYRTTRLFFSGGTAVWIRIENADTATAGLRIVHAAQGDDIVSSVRAAILTKRLEVTQSWTERKTLDLQPDGGPLTVGGTLGVTGATTLAALSATTIAGTTGAFSGDFAVATNKFTVASASGNTAVAGTLGVTGATTLAALSATTGAFSGNFAVATNKFTANATTGDAVTAGTSTAGSFIPTSATVPSLGMYKPMTADTLAWAVATTSKLYLDGSNLYPVANDGLALGKSGSGFADAFFASGAVLNFDAGDVTVTHGSNVLTFAGGRFLFGSSTDDGSTVLQVNGTAKITGTATLAAFNASAQSTVNLSGTSISSVAGLVLGLAAVDGLGAAQLLDARAANPQISFRRANGTSTAMTALASGDIIGNIQFRGHDGSALTTTRATIEATAAETWSGSANGTNLLFKTSTIGAATATTRVTITDAGNLVMATGLLCRYAANITSAAGTTRTDATQLSREFTRLNTVASGTGVILPTGVIGMYVTIYNGGANAVKVYANGSETIDGTAGSTGVTLTNGNACMFVFSTTNTWHSFLMGGRSA